MFDVTTPSTPAGADARPAAIARNQRRAALGRVLRRMLVVGAVVFVMVEAVSLGLWALGTKECDDRGRCVVTEWYPMHIQPRARTETLNGVRDGLRIHYHSNGAVHYAGNYQRGERVGPWREYYRDGTPRFEGLLEDGVRVGPERWWYANGELELELNRVNGKRHGVETWYHPNGEVRRVGTWKDGERSGVFRVFSPEGELAFENGSDVGDGEDEDG
jgi:hypothetical protein